MGKYIMALDQGTTSSRTILFDKNGKIVCQANKEFEQIFPKPGLVEHNPEEIWMTQLLTMEEIMNVTGIKGSDIDAIGITNQRETTVVWDKNTGKPIYNAIVWQCRRTADIVDALVNEGYGELIKEKTGLVPDAYFSGTKIKWILDNVKGARKKAENGELLFGTIDTWLMWKLSGGAIHATDYTNASRTMIYNIRDLKWDEELLKILDIPQSMLPNKGEVKNTYGTGCFLLMNTGDKIVKSSNGLITTIAASTDKVEYALEGSVFVAGAAIQWLRDQMRIVENAPESERIASMVEDSDGVYVVPAFTGMGAPYWKQNARGMAVGITRGTSREHFVRATLESLAYQTYDVLKAMEQDLGEEFNSMKVDGGASANNLLMQFQSDITGKSVIRPSVIETTGLGAAYLAGLATGYWKSKEEIIENQSIDRQFDRQMPDNIVNNKLKGWKRAVRCAMVYADEE